MLLIAALCVVGVIFLFKFLLAKPALAPSMRPSVEVSTSSQNKILVATLSIQPTTIIQGDPIMVTVNNVSPALLKSITFSGEPLQVVTYDAKLRAFVGLDLNKKPGTYTVTATLTNGKTLQKKVIVGARTKTTAPLGIPAALGGNTSAAASTLVSSLASDNQTLAKLPSAQLAYWSSAFHFPVENPVVTDSYGYTRATGQYTISHKGTDFAAASGTPVLAINTGVVVYVGSLTTYGNTIVIDHGLGLQSFYMHLSTVSVRVGQMVHRGDIIGASGETGYAEGPHLHLTVRIDGISIDPLIFLRFFQ